MPAPRLPRGVRPGSRLLAALVAAPLVLGGCAAEAATAGNTSPRAAGSPPESALMVCGDEIRGKVAQILDLSAPPRTADTWADSVYTCTYSLPMGQMVLTVTVTPDETTAGRAFDALPAKRPGSAPLLGLGERALGTADGTVDVLKDGQILTVDTTGLPEVFGPEDQKRIDLAYEVASDVLGCWTGDEHQ